MAIAWSLYSKDVSTAITGFSKVSHVEENIKGLELYRKFTPEIEAKIETLFQTRPKRGIDFKTHQPLPARR